MTTARAQLAAAKAAGNRRKAAHAVSALVRQLGWPGHVTEHRFAPPRRWRLDLAWPASRLAVEVEGGSWVGGRHTRAEGFQSDIEKYAEAAAAGWLVLRVTHADIRTGRASRWVRQAAESFGRVPAGEP